jgi:hypothetical protein
MDQSEHNLEKQYILPGKLRDALINFLRSMAMETVEEPVTLLRSLRAADDAPRAEPPVPEATD